MALAAGAYLSRGSWTSAQEPVIAELGALVPVERGPLTIKVASSGSIRSGNAVIIKNKVEGRTTILSLIEEGTLVSAGDLLMELDSSALMDQKLEEEIEVETSRASFISAEQMLEITRKEGQAKIEAAAVDYRLALLDLERYAGVDTSKLEQSGEPIRIDQAESGSLLAELNALATGLGEGPQQRVRFRELIDQLEGTYKQEMLKALNAIVIADAEVLRAKERLDGSQHLFDRNFLSTSELETDRLTLQRRTLDLEVALADVGLLAKFTYKRTIEELSSSVNQKRFALEKARHESQANLVDAQATLNARRERLVRDEQNLEEINEQIAACTIRAPCNGMVVYGTTGRDNEDREPLAEGIEVRERQDLFRVPTTDLLVADLKIHESMLDLVAEGQDVRLSSDALPGRTFAGRITKIAVMPDAQSRWLNPNLKVYNTVVEVIGDHADLRTGMSCRAEILVEEFLDTLYVPLQAVVRVKDQPTVFVPNALGQLEPRTVEVGLDNEQVVQVLSGIEEGTMVSLTPPLQEGRTGSDAGEDRPTEQQERTPKDDATGAGDSGTERGPAKAVPGGENAGGIGAGS